MPLSTLSPILPVAFRVSSYWKPIVTQDREIHFSQYKKNRDNKNINLLFL